MLWHLGDAWARRDEPNVVLVHYDDLVADLDGEMRLLAACIGSPDWSDRWATLVDAAGFESMRARADMLAPDPDDVLIDPPAFFRRSGPSEAWDLLDRGDLEHYRRRVSALAPTGLVEWLHRGR